MKNKMPKLISAIGLFILGVSWFQWFFAYRDLSQLVLGNGIAVCFMAFGYIYGWMKGKDEEMKKLNKRIDGLIKLYTKGEFE